MTVAEKLTAVAENMPAVYEGGRRKEWNSFWDVLQQKGARTNYNRGFFGWAEECFLPKYPFICYNNATALQETFAYGTIEDIKVPVKLTVAGTLNATFSGAKNLHTVPRLEVDANIKFNNTFNNCQSLVNLTMAGVIGQSGLNVSSCPLLTVESIMTIIGCLKDYKGSGATYTVSLGTENLAKLSDARKAAATEKGWSLT